MFWFNPFVWLYKKAITQNLEYIADQKAIEQLEDKKSYQRALLKVVSHQSCLSITNNFYQSLIKKRIVMLNKNQSHKRNSWKYALIIPALIGFVFLFQIKTIAQEKEEQTFAKKVQDRNEIRLVVDKNSTDAELKKDAALLKEKHGITLKYSKVKRNSAGEITCIKVEYKDKDGSKGVSQVDGKEPIKPIHFYKNDGGIGFGTPKQVRIFANNNSTEDRVIELAIDDSTDVTSNFDFNFDFDIKTPEAPEAPESPEAAEAPSLPRHFWNDADSETKIIVKKDGAKPLVILNGKVIEGDESVISKKELDELINSSSKSSDSDAQIIINGKDVMKIRTDAMANAKMQMKRMKPMMKRQMELVRSEKGKARAEMDKAQAEMDAAKPEMEKAKAEMLLAKEEMLKAKAEMDAAKAELEKARAELKNQKK
jgi:hypothetical protein